MKDKLIDALCLKVMLGEPLSPDDVKGLCSIVPCDTEAPTVEGYAEHLKNYLYTYKPEATAIDDAIDPNEEHIGPMAQDIENVAPDCIKETPEGVKTVDGSRLALVNAGVIGELSRRLLQLEKRMLSLEEKLYE